MQKNDTGLKHFSESLKKDLLMVSIPHEDNSVFRIKWDENSIQQTVKSTVSLFILDVPWNILNTTKQNPNLFCVDYIFTINFRWKFLKIEWQLQTKVAFS